MSFEESLARLDAIVQELDSDRVDLDRALRLFEEGVERLREASSELARAEARAKLLVERSDGTFELPELADGPEPRG
jgi:exodeoxyribonuclease VII small subunit